MLDFGSYAVPLLGHRHPAVVAAVRAQLDTLPTATRALANPTLVAAAGHLVDYFGGGLPRVYCGLNGADVVEVAAKLARLRTGRSRIVAVEGGYHGKSLGALALTHHPMFRGGLAAVLPAVTHVPPDNPAAVDAEAGRGDVAAVVFEPVQGENGVHPIPVDVLRRWCVDAHRHGAFVVADEIQCGLRRCGPRALSLDAGLPVDALLVGKPLGGGVVPMSAMLCSEDLFRPLAENPFLHTATFAGHPLCAAAVGPTLAVLEDLAGAGARLAAQMAHGLRDLARLHPDLVTEVRGQGLLWGLDFASPDVAGEVMLGVVQRGLIISPCLSRPTTLRLLPPLVATAADVARGLDMLDEAVRAAGTATGCR
jgi:putrescine aminotransferase